jgi:predicted adenine nucleotide alpha hydrolase (AANH) superfamily ATPase
LYSALAELIQHYVPGRTVSRYDFLAGVIGSAVFALIAYLRFKREKPFLLLHICCVGCGAFVADLLRKEYSVVLFFYNPNIFPKSEYDLRLQETVRVAKKLGLPLLVGDGNHSAWLKKVQGHENDPERGKRCSICYYDRLAKTAHRAKQERIKYFSSTLSVSPHKDAGILSQIGQSIEKESGVKFIDRDFKKNNGYAQSVKLSRDLNLYRQNYCGCEFSKR